MVLPILRMIACFTTITRFIEANLASRELGIEKITRTFALSRASLYRLFEPVGGVACYIRTRRLARARKELTAPGLQDHRIGPIAYRAGFQSIPAFNRAFRAAYGEPPRRARQPEGGLVVSTAIVKLYPGRLHFAPDNDFAN